MIKELYLKDIEHVQLLSKKQQEQLWLKSLDGDERSWSTLWLQGVRMVQKLVRKFIERGVILREDEMDAIQVGNLAIGEALPAWSPNRGAYSTYIWVCIRNALLDWNDRESRSGLTGGFDFDEVHVGPMELGESDRTVADWWGYGHDLDIDHLALYMDYDDLLDENQREVMDMLIWHDMSQDHVGRVSGRSQATVSRIVRDSLDIMRSAYSKSV